MITDTSVHRFDSWRTVRRIWCDLHIPRICRRYKSRVFPKNISQRSPVDRCVTFASADVIWLLGDVGNGRRRQRLSGHRRRCVPVGRCGHSAYEAGRQHHHSTTHSPVACRSVQDSMYTRRTALQLLQTSRVSSIHRQSSEKVYYPSLLVD